MAYSIVSSVVQQNYATYSNEPIPAKMVTFGFKHWKQRKFFNLSNADKGWYLSLFERLRDICNYTVEDFRANRIGNVRFHPINWNNKNIPVKRNDFATSDWLGLHFFDEENELYQFHVSKSKGRIVGYFDPTEIFQIVVLDRDHNFQPYKPEYKITVNKQEHSNFDILLSLLNKQEERCRRNACAEWKNLNRIREKHTDEIEGKIALQLTVDEAYYDELIRITIENQCCISELFELGIVGITDFIN